MCSGLIPLVVVVVTGMLPRTPALPALMVSITPASEVLANRDNSGTSRDRRKSEMPQPSAKSGVTASQETGAKKPGFFSFQRNSSVRRGAIAV